MVGRESVWGEGGGREGGNGRGKGNKQRVSHKELISNSLKNITVETCSKEDIHGIQTSYQSPSHTTNCALYEETKAMSLPVGHRETRTSPTREDWAWSGQGGREGGREGGGQKNGVCLVMGWRVTKIYNTFTGGTCVCVCPTSLSCSLLVAGLL